MTLTRNHNSARADAIGWPAFRKRTKILIVDSSASRRQDLRAILYELEYELIQASGTSEAIAAISLFGVDLVLLGSSVGEISAIEFCRMLKKTDATKFLPVFVIGGSNDVDAEVRALEAGANDFLITPLRPRAFRARIEASLRHKAIIDTLDNAEAVLLSVAQSVEGREPGLGRHCQRLAFIAGKIGTALGLPPDDIEALERGGYLHDIGKVTVPDRVLLKPGPLNSEEWELMKAHSERGARICSHVQSLAPVLPIIRHHHEKWDGTGYPDGLRGDSIPLLARIVQVADIYDALTTERPYKRAFTSSEALQIMRSEAQKGWRDAKLIEVFADLLPKLSGQITNGKDSDGARLSLQALAHSLERHQQTYGYSEAALSMLNFAGGI
jgi:putative two-component system response regulator